MSAGRKNRLAKETSPYLLQHAGNPVDWYPWGDEAFAKAAAEERPVFLSIGYSACHWCHVMERESFENEEIAAILNRDFVSIKVDREERPDVDAIYMQAVQMMTGHGGWPMSMFLTPSGLPFYGGTYFPPEDGRGMPGFRRILQHVAHTYRERRGDVDEATAEIRRAVSASFEVPGKPEAVTHAKLDAAAARIGQSFDPIHGGFGTAPKFPPSMTIDFLLQTVARGGAESTSSAKVVETTLRKMAMGGIYDQIGGGFHRYSVDAHWLVPHFEKMLYDNALLSRVYVRAWQWTKEPLFRRIARETLDFVSRELTSPEGGFYSTLDADSEGVEGKFYVWSREEIISVLGEREGAIVCTLFGVSAPGNWEGSNILNLPREPSAVAAQLGISLAELEEIVSRAKCKLYGRREERIRPARDEKILASWNGWMLGAFAEASIAFGSVKDAATVRSSADFLIGKMSDGDRLFRSYKEGERKIGGMLEDYAGVAWGLLLAFDAVGDLRYLDAARRFAIAIIDRFADPTGGFFDTPSDHEALITRPRDLFDNATPSGNSLAIAVFLRLAALDGNDRFEEIARSAVEQLFQLASRHPSGFGFLLGDAEWLTGTPREIVVTGPANGPIVAALLAAIGDTFVPHRVIATSAAEGSPLLEGKPSDKSMAYVCRRGACLEPTDDPERLRQLLRQN